MLSVCVFVIVLSPIRKISAQSAQERKDGLIKYQNIIKAKIKHNEYLVSALFDIPVQTIIISPGDTLFLAPVATVAEKARLKTQILANIDTMAMSTDSILALVP